MAGNKGFRNLPKLERLKRGRSAPGPPPSRRGAGRLPRPRPALPSHVVALTDFPPQHQHALRVLAELPAPPHPAPPDAPHLFSSPPRGRGRVRGGEDKGEGAFVVGGGVRGLLLLHPAVGEPDLAPPA